MKINDEYISHSIFSEYFSEMIRQFETNDVMLEIMPLVITELGHRIVEIINNLKNRKYADARSLLGIKDMFADYNFEVIKLRATLKSFISGIIITSAITDQNEIADYQKKWNDYDDSEKSNNPAKFPHQFIYQQFKKVNTLEELAEFNEYFHQYLVEMAFKLAVILIRRMTFTIEYLKDDEIFNESCYQAADHLELFQAEIEKLKEKPYQ